MTTEAKYTEGIISLPKLNKNMRILEFVGFSSQYNEIDEMTCKWLKLNFKGSKIKFNRDGQKMETSIEQLKVGDSLICINDLPQNLEKLTKVSDKLIQEFDNRGFLKFKVRSFQKVQTKEQKQRLENVRKSNELVQKVKQNVKTSEETAQAIENLLDNARKGKVNTTEIKSYVDSITNNSSSEALIAMTSLKQSDQTYSHCVDVGVIFLNVYKKIIAKRGEESRFESDKQAMLGAFMHDFGKSKVPKEVLDSKARFDRDSKEMKLMQSHPEIGAKLLEGMGMPDLICNMAKFHHVKLDTNMNSSYPKVDNYDMVEMETKLLSMIDIYQALVGRRSYKKSWAPPAAMRYLDALAGVEFDIDLWDEFLAAMGLYPVSSLVELSDGSQAFVMLIPENEDDLETPTVAVIKNAAGEIMTNNTLLDLSKEKDLSIAKDLDSIEVFGKESLEVFASLKIV